MSVKKLKDNLPKLKRAMESFAKREVLVGIPSDETGNERHDATITNAQIGFINEFGAPEKNIPPRPFLIPGVRAIWNDAQKRLAKGAEKILKLNGDPIGIEEKALEGAGLMAQNSVVQTINNGIEPALKESTIAARQRKGFAGEKPLIVTGALKQSITYVVKQIDD
ncbi:MAG: hypothetical protein H5T98_01055 [Syntrophomonadaceae bacterium]|nr:hypothetical protein [Syntrophomonadaceae bacterium]